MTAFGKLVFGGSLLVIICGGYFYINRNTDTEYVTPVVPSSTATTTEEIATSTQVENISTTTPTKSEHGFITGKITIGPNCPVERADNPCTTPPEAYSSRLVIVYEDDGETIKERWKIDTQGIYKITIEPGKYFLQVKPAGIGQGEKKPVTVKSNETTEINFDIDTGIR